ncbi:hypothetical protein M569_11563, partial [Genlisea aurea]
LLPPVPPAQHPAAHGGLRPGSMAERARLANIQIPEAALKCPRCESTNTKFCYFNNYSLTQPRHFCKTCRRYWTRGGALRNVPVGGGCRRNKRSKTSSGSSTTTTTKSPASSDRHANGGAANSSSNATISTTNGGSLLGLNPQLTPPLRFISPLTHQLTDAFTSDMVGLSYNAMAPPILGTNEVPNFTGNNNNNHNSVLDTWRLQQYPFLSGLETSHFWAAGDSSFMAGETSNNNNNNNQVSVRPAPKLQNSILGGVKMEGTLPQLNISRHLMGGLQGGNEQWNAGAGGAPWNELSSFSSSSTSNHL